MNMIPCAFADLGKAARDLFDRDYCLGLIKVTHKGKTVNDLDLTLSGSRLLNSHDAVGSISGFLEAKYKIPAHGVSLTQKWTTNSVLTTDVTIEDRFVKGLKKSIELTFEPVTGKKAAKLKTAYKQKYVNTNVDLDFQSKMPILSGGLVLGCLEKYGFLLGAQATYDTSTETLNKVQYALGCDRGDLVLHSQLVNHKELQASVYQRVNAKVETGIMASYAHNTKVSRFAAAVKYGFDKDAFVKAKVDTSCLVHVAYGLLLRDGFRVTVSGQVDGKNLDAGNHAIGLNLDFES